MTLFGRREILAAGAAGLLMPSAVRAGSSETAWLERMAAANVPGMSVALVRDGKLRWARGIGLARKEDRVSVTAATRFQAASISKPVAVLAALKLVERGALDLDRPVLDHLQSWRPDDPAAWAGITLRQLMTHSAGLGVHGFAGYALGAALPTPAEIMDGTPPANSPAVTFVQMPGKWLYSGGGITLMQTLMSDVTDRDFAALAQELVLGPLGMRSSSFVQPPAADGSYACGHQSDGTEVEGGWHIYPEQAAAGLWTTPADLARFTAALMTSTAMLTPQPNLDARGSRFGLGLFMNNQNEPRYFFHGGSNAGFRCVMLGLPDTGDGAVVMTNGDNGGAAARDMVRSLASARGWLESGFPRL